MFVGSSSWKLKYQSIHYISSCLFTFSYHKFAHTRAHIPAGYTSWDRRNEGICQGTS